MAYLVMDALAFFHARRHGATSACGGAEAARRWASRPWARAPRWLCVLELPWPAARAQATPTSCRSWLGPRSLAAREAEAWGTGTGGHGTE